ncbi:RNase RNM [Alkalimonas mucilaginosa]|uniref:PHP domain-containing protein n=1 Tax=Alkalimonas mucilaginosa TaxID=3057676 RepID=A0ABU7JH64_9GAMM|nr:PHP domain-containing protein [Alkalimonas sp. MEB004]MEE2024982.1 PHP domain-containing protein [Alkalimonas sp. MEB004]
MKIDLHSHTRHSDGLLTPQELLQRAELRGVNVLAITDHDTVAAIPEARQYLAEHGTGLQLIAGVELSTNWQSFEIHVVGLNIDPDCAVLQGRLQQQLQKRTERVAAIAERLSRRCKLPDIYAGVEAMANGAALTRAHVARYLVQQGMVEHMGKAFDKYLGRGKPGYVPPSWVELAEAIGWIQQAGGQAVLAHPLKYKLSGKWLRRLVVDFAAAGGDAMEVVSPQQTPQQRAELWALCQQYGLLASVGSDFHQPTPWNELGKNLYLTEEMTPVWANWPLVGQQALPL